MFVANVAPSSADCDVGVNVAASGDPDIRSSRAAKVGSHKNVNFDPKYITGMTTIPHARVSFLRGTRVSVHDTFGEVEQSAWSLIANMTYEEATTTRYYYHVYNTNPPRRTTVLIRVIASRQWQWTRL